MTTPSTNTEVFEEWEKFDTAEMIDLLERNGYYLQ